jgi:hypothetical protein
MTDAGMRPVRSGLTVSTGSGKEKTVPVTTLDSTNLEKILDLDSGLNL